MTPNGKRQRECYAYASKRIAHAAVPAAAPMSEAFAAARWHISR